MYMKVKLLSYSQLADKSQIVEGQTECDSIVMRAIAECYQTQPSLKALRRCFLEKHHSVFEHISFTFKVYNISRACLAQLTRHRIASYTVESQRYNDYTKKAYRAVIPYTIVDDDVAYLMMMEHIKKSQEVYESLRKRGIPAQDARFVLPEATGVNLTFTMNARELMHAFDLRLAKDAQWEIRYLFAEILKLVKPLAPKTFEAYEVPNDLVSSQVYER